MTMETAPAQEGSTMSFLDARVFVVGANAAGTHVFHAPDHLGYEQEERGPTYVVVGPSVSDERLKRAVCKWPRHFGLTLETLTQARDLQPSGRWR